MNKRILIGFFLITILLMTGSAWALSTSGTPIIAIDGDTDGNVSVDILSVGGTSTYTYGYFLNGSANFISLGSLNFSTFQGGDIIDFALSDGTRYYTLSGDSADSSYSVLMTFDNQVIIGSAQQPAGWTNPYYYNVNISWSIGGTGVNTNEYAMSLVNNANDGVAPVPEPSTLMLLGSGLLGLGYFGRKRIKG